MSVFQSINPATADVIHTYEGHTAAEVEQHLAQAAVAFAQWRRWPIAERASCMRRAAAILRERSSDYARLMTLEMGKPIKSAHGEVERSAAVAEFYAERAAEFLQDEVIDKGPPRITVRYEPLGPLLAVLPWNFPFWMVFRFFGPALMAGNVGLLKHAPGVMGCALAIANVFREAGFPPGVCEALLVDVVDVPAIIADRRVRGVTLTGSERAGSAVAAQAGAALKKSVLELGGSDAFIVLADADLPRAAQQGVASRVSNNGQSCNAAKRFIVEKPVVTAFCELLNGYMQRLKVGDPLEETTDIGPQARLDLLRRVEDQVARSVALGATCILGGSALAGPGYYYPPTILTGVRPGMPAYDDEIFGPVASVIQVADEAEAVLVANDTRFGLSAAVWTRDVDRGQRVAAELEVGAAFVNKAVTSDFRLPFGGVKNSGYGRELSWHGIREFVSAKPYWVDSGST